jgi:trehalose 6-phosphate synthase/phosphatase
VRAERGGFTLERSSGGLASGLGGLHDEMEGSWIGWPGETPRITAEQRRELEASLSELRIVPVYMTRREVKGFYEDVANEVLWPVLHYRLDQMPLKPTGWSTYRKVNERFAAAVVAAYQPGDTVWVHDYQLVLVPQLVRREVPEARIGFFLHVPFPSADVFGVVPWREEILEGLLGADLVGFHTPEFARHFLDACHQLLGLRVSAHAVERRERHTAVGAFPLGIDTQLWSEMAVRPDVVARAAQIRAEAQGRKLLVGMDRLDYTKGLLRRFVALEILFQSEPALAQRLKLIQVIVPSREGIEYYASLKRRVDEVIGRINGRYGTTADAPVRVLNRNLSVEEITALYRAADIMLVTPLRDGMNLVAKEFVATRSNDDGVLVLSEFAGAARELKDAVMVNPYDVEDMARKLRQALDMSPREANVRMRKLRLQVLNNDVDVWTQKFLTALAAAGNGGQALEVTA